MSNGNKQKEVMKFVKEGNLQVCAIIETHIKAKKIKDVCGKVFGDWEWITNSHYSTNSCKIMLSWNPLYAKVYVIQDERKLLWKEMFMHKRICGSYSWALLGDMNVTLNIKEHLSGGFYITEEMQEFRDCINSVELEDIGSSGFYFTWTKSLKNPEARVLKKLDRVMSFRFANYIADKPEFIKKVEDGWKAQFHGYKMYCLIKKLKHLKPIINKLNWKNGDLTVRVELTRVKLQEAQTLVEKNPHNFLIKEKAVQALYDYNKTVKDEEKLLAQKARINWLNEGDKNSSFFHKVIKGRRSRNRVDVIWIVKTYLALLTQDGAEDMIKDVSDKEIKEAMFDIEDNKAPGPDGYSSLFFKRAWGIVGNDVCSAIKEFFDSRQMLEDLNATLITLVPKIQTPIEVYDFRPISCCNVLYKCISKVITNKIKGGLKKLVQINQSAFIPRRVIQDNILLSQEILRGYGRQQGPKRCAIKIDLQKAFDTVNWDFLEIILNNFGFHQKMVGWIMKCVRTTGFSMCINGERHGYFKGGRGLRQRDPMSPYLFTLIMEMLTLILQRKIKNNDSFEYHHGCKELQLVNLCFADDFMIFCNGDPISVGLIKDALNEFSEIFGMFPNLNKSTLFFGSLKDADKEQIKDVMHFNEGMLPSKYLGVPLITKRLGSNGDSAKGKTKIAWKYVCRPKEFGGLGIKNHESWNEALLSKLLWNIASKKYIISRYSLILRFPTNPNMLCKKNLLCSIREQDRRTVMMRVVLGLKKMQQKQQQVAIMLQDTTGLMFLNKKKMWRQLIEDNVQQQVS
ncbi:RNA-directed DNA polymerase, eukaryota, reverse transcriptase zinc-binding domain protein [Tanacetum coccineum]